LQIKIIFRKIQKVDKIKFSPILKIIDDKITLMNRYIDQAYDNDASAPSGSSPGAPTRLHTWVDKLQDYLYYKIYKYFRSKNENDVPNIEITALNNNKEKYINDVKAIIDQKMDTLSFSTKSVSTFTDPTLNMTIIEFIDKVGINTVINTYNSEYVNNSNIHIIDTYQRLHALLTGDNATINSFKQTAGTEIPEVVTTLINTEYDIILPLIEKDIKDNSSPISSTTTTGDDSPFESEESARNLSLEEYLKKLIPYIVKTIGGIAINVLNSDE
jgi:hypothetical protein